MTLRLLVQIAGLLQLGLAAAHLGFPKRFGWREELARLSLLNRQIFLVHTLFICLMLAMMGVLSVFGVEALLTPSTLGRWVLAGFAMFWLARLLAQWLIYDWSLWRGHRVNAIIHAAFTILWIFLASVYGAAWWRA